jgi:multidrug resistance efflux pump
VQNCKSILWQCTKADYARYENAFKTGGVTKQQLDQAKLALTNAGANLKQANINVGDTR